MVNAAGPHAEGTSGATGGAPANGRAWPPRQAGPAQTPATPPRQAGPAQTPATPPRQAGPPQTPPTPPRQAGQASVPAPHQRPPGRSAEGGARPTGQASVPAARRPSGGAVYGAAAPVQVPSQVVASPPRVRRKRRGLAALLAAVLVSAAIAAGAAMQLQRALPSAQLITTVAGTLRIPGSAPTLPWPSSGSAELTVEGLGRLGGSKSGTPSTDRQRRQGHDGVPDPQEPPARRRRARPGDHGDRRGRGRLPCADRERAVAGAR